MKLYVVARLVASENDANAEYESVLAICTSHESAEELIGDDDDGLEILEEESDQWR